MMDKYSRTLSNFELSLKFPNSNSICRVCLGVLHSMDELLSENCIDCRNYVSSRSSMKRSNSLISKKDRVSLLSTLLQEDKIEETKTNIIRLFRNIKNGVIENSKNLKSVLDRTILDKIREVNSFKNSVNTKMFELKNSAENQIHLIDLPKDNTVGVILNKLLNNEKIGNTGVFNYRIDPEIVINKIKESHISTPINVNVFSSEPELKYFIPRPLFKFKKFKFFSESFEDVPILNVKEFEWPEKGNFIEYQENDIIYAGEVGFFSTKGVWNIDTSQKNINAILIGNFPGRVDHSLEYLNQNIYLLGGNSKKIQCFSLIDQKGWKTLINLPEEIGYSHSVRIGETVFLVGANSKNVYKYFIKENKLETENYQFFSKGQNKLIFDLDGKELIFSNSQVVWKREILCKTGESFSKLRCPGKGKIIYSYLYFATYNEKFESKVWRLCLRSFLLVNFS